MGPEFKCPTSVSSSGLVRNRKNNIIYCFILKTADEKLRLRYHLINFTGGISDFKWCSRHYFQVGGGQNLNFELSATQH